MPSLGPLALLDSGVSGPRVVVLGGSVAARTGVLLADAIVLAAMAAPSEERRDMFSPLYPSCGASDRRITVLILISR